MQVFNLQGSQWNQGSSGRFCVNVGVYFAQLEGTVKRFKRTTEHEKLQPYHCHFYLRLHDVVPSKREPWWPAQLTPGQDAWFEVGPEHELLALGDSLCRVVESYLLPWFAERASVEALALGLAPTDIEQRAVALALLGRKEEARQHAASSRDAALKAWLED